MHTTRPAALAVSIAVLLGFSPAAWAQLPAFPGAVGFGAVATGGRGGRVLHVTTLAASGPGSLAEAAAQSGARIIVFDVSGVIEGDVEITNGDVTIAGQTAPGAGITIHGHLTTPYGENVENIVIRHIRVRPPGQTSDWPAEQHDAIQLSDAHRVIFDHVDVSHGIDENVDHWNGASDVTWQSSILSFPNPNGGHPDGAHPFCLINSDGETGGGDAGGRISIVGNLFAFCLRRAPALSVGPAEVVNNVVYGAAQAFVHHNPAYGDFVIAGNTYRSGGDASMTPLWFDAENDSPPTRYFVGDNRVDDPGVFEGRVDNPWTTAGYSDAYAITTGTVDDSQFFALANAPAFGAGHVPVTRVTPAEAYERVLDCAGAWPRDFVSRTAVEETRARTGSIRTLPLTNLLDGLTPGAAPADGDRDGMPDAWEQEHGLDPAADDHNTPLAGGWPALEVYLDERATALACQTTTPGGPGTGGATAGTGGGGGAGGVGGASTSAGDSSGCGCGLGGFDGGGGGVAAWAVLVGLSVATRRRARREPAPKRRAARS